MLHELGAVASHRRRLASPARPRRPRRQLRPCAYNSSEGSHGEYCEGRVRRACCIYGNGDFSPRGLSDLAHLPMVLHVLCKRRQSRVESHSQPGMYSRAARLGAGLTLARMRSLAAGGGCRSCAAAASEGQAFVTVFAVKYGEVVLFGAFTRYPSLETSLPVGEILLHAELGDQVSHTTAAHGCEQGGSEEEYEMYACYRRARRLNLCSVDILASKRGLIGSLASGVLESSGGTPTDRVFAALTLRRGS
ncbi:hypothetical protein OF846_000709 [Rhodotorula toruloides]|nr:hypothetical protein OF846_000709 [Rhodotorula toruloides]